MKTLGIGTEFAVEERKKKAAMGQSMNKRKSFHETELFMYKYVFFLICYMIKKTDSGFKFLTYNPPRID